MPFQCFTEGNLLGVKFEIERISSSSFRLKFIFIYYLNAILPLSITHNLRSCHLSCLIDHHFKI